MMYRTVQYNMIEWVGPLTKSRSTSDKRSECSFDGVYLICESIGNHDKVRYVGQGNIQDRLTAHSQPSEQNLRLKELMNEKSDHMTLYYTKVNDAIHMNDLEHTAFVDFGGSSKLYNEKEPPGNYIYPINYPEKASK